jgi:hypothetical protein
VRRWVVQLDGPAPHAQGAASGGPRGAHLLGGEVRVVDELLEAGDDRRGDVVLVVLSPLGDLSESLGL